MDRRGDGGAVVVLEVPEIVLNAPFQVALESVLLQLGIDYDVDDIGGLHITDEVNVVRLPLEVFDTHKGALLLTAIYRAYRAERKNTGYFADAFEELGAWLWKSPGMHIVVMGNIKHKEIPESEGHQGSLHQ